MQPCRRALSWVCSAIPMLALPRSMVLGAAASLVCSPSAAEVLGSGPFARPDGQVQGGQAGYPIGVPASALCTGGAST